MGLTRDEYERILELLGREPTLTELGMFAVMWSEHCGYKYSRPVLAYFRKYKEAMEGDGLENAGVVDVGDGFGVAFKVESHNHPSAVEPYQGAATGVGGIIRDIFTMGARPIASLNSLRFGPIRTTHAPSEVAERNRFLFEGVVEGIAGYGNCVGVPTVAGEVAFHESYSGNPLVNAMCVGLVRLDEIATAEAAGIGNPVIYLGSATGRDGIHGATFASDALGEDNEAKRPNVQIGDPFAEKLLIEATLEALRTGAVQSIQDMGAAGLTCSTVEMSSKGGVGMDVDLDLVPMRESDMSGYELMLSESQERMLCVAHAGREQEVVEVFQRWGVHAVVVGRVTDSGLVRVRRHGEVICEADARLFTHECPTYRVEPRPDPASLAAADWRPERLPSTDLAEALGVLLESPNLASKRWVFRQYDQQVQTQTVRLPGQGDAAVLAPRGMRQGLAVKIDGNSRWTRLDPYVGGLLAVAEAARNVACVGAKPTAATDGLNFGDPRDPVVYWQFERAVRGIADACEALGTPIVSGNVSFYNQSDLGSISPTPIIGMLGVLPSAERHVGLAVRAGLELGLLETPIEPGPQQGLGASEYLAEIHRIEDGRPISPNLAGEKLLAETLVRLVANGEIEAAHDVSEGGLAVCLAEMAIAGRVGLQVPEMPSAVERDDARWFGEFPGQVVIAYEPESFESIAASVPSELRFRRIGSVGGETLVLDGISMDLDSLASRFEAALPALMSH